MTYKVVIRKSVRMIQPQRRSCFVAIGVGQGDAFFLDRGQLTILVDGGRSIEGFPCQFLRATKRESVDVLVCTHNDADHANGVLGFLRGGLTCREVWLPGSWAYRLEKLLLEPEEFTRELVLNIKDMEVPPERSPSDQDLWDQNRESNDDASPTEKIDLSDLSEALQGATNMGTYEEVFWPYLPMWPPGMWHDLYLLRSMSRENLFIEALAAAARIRKIALAAYNMGASIRWFEYDNKNKGGGNPGCLVPINACEVHQLHVRHRSAWEYIALTTSNKQSLVFLSPADDREPAVLFTADSDLSFSQCIRWTDGMIVTAPHHGSEANKDAYDRFARETGNARDVIWVRSDGRSKDRPGNSYLKVHGCHFCTLCRGSNLGKQDVRLIVDQERWMPCSTRRCCCNQEWVD
jgi:hypothetical protein